MLAVLSTAEMAGVQSTCNNEFTEGSQRDAPFRSKAPARDGGAALGSQTTNVTSTPFTVSSAFTFTFPAPGVFVTPANAPNRFIYFSLGLTDSVAPSFAAASVPVAFNVAPSAFGASAPILAAKFIGGGAVQPATFVSPTTVAAASLVWLT